MEFVAEDTKRLTAERPPDAITRPSRIRYPTATASSTTARGGRIFATSGIVTVGGRIALVGDLVRYPDGSEARIVSGAGEALRYRDRPVALIGSMLDNGDIITGPAHHGLAVIRYSDDPPIPGLLEADFAASQPKRAQP
ncbi:PAAR domain-containing protein [Denitromonas sp.]|uniref:PAAR domain-containing protein n=1 Tax=Denitromonas sp. TaxID=2734609 RepID=UPI003A8A1687